MKINTQFEKDSEFIKELSLCQLRLMKDGDLDWFMLIPKIENVKEVIDLSEEDQLQLMKEIAYVSKMLKIENKGKINIGMLGNVVSDLHIHVLARSQSDRAWPGPIWGTKAINTFDPNRVSFWDKKFNS